jgi:ketosteroid isomerase-like protein
METAAMEPAELHRRVEAGVNSGDIEALVSLYEPDAQFFDDQGNAAVGHDAIRSVYSMVAGLGTIELITRYAIEVGDLALLSNTWIFDAEGFHDSAITAEVARRQPDGTWLYVIDNPYSSRPG